MESTPVPRRSERLRNLHDCNVLFLENNEPTTYAEAMESPDSELWLEAMRSELKSMDDNQVWNLVDLLDGVRAIECKWIFKKKMILTEMSQSIRLDLLLKVIDKFKELTTMRLTHR